MPSGEHYSRESMPSDCLLYMALSLFHSKLSFPVVTQCEVCSIQAIHIKKTVCSETGFLFPPEGSCRSQSDRAWCSAVLAGCRHEVVLAAWRLMRSADAFVAFVLGQGCDWREGCRS